MSKRPETIELSKLREIIRREYSRWATVEVDADREFVMGCVMGVMGACANILCAAEGFEVMEYQPHQSESTDANTQL